MVAPGNDNILVPLRFSVDQRSNSIIAAGTVEDLAVVEAILLRLDESDARDRVTRVYRLKNLSAESVATSVTQFLDREREVQDTAPGVVSPYDQLEREVVVVAEAASNSLIISSTPDYVEEVLDLIEQLDSRPKMVMIQVLIAEVGLGTTDEFGVELGLQDSLLFDRSLLEQIETISKITTTSTGGDVTTVQEDIIVSASNQPGFNFNNTNPLGNSGAASSLATAANTAGQIISNFAVARGNAELGYGGLVLAAGGDSVSVLLRALQDDRRLEILSRPQVMTLDNQQAFVQVGQQVPMISGVTFNAGVQSNTTRMEDVGIILLVTPRISPDGLVVMQIDATKSSVGPEDEGIPISISANGNVVRSPRIDTTRTQTTVSAVSGQTIVLGGLITKRTQEIHRRVPYIADIPLIGDLFRFDSVAERRTELLIIMTPHIIENPEDAEIIKQVESARMSWCLSDVIDIHGQVGLRSRSDEWADHETTTIYPDMHDVEMHEFEEPTVAPEPLDAPTQVPDEPLLRGSAASIRGTVQPAAYRSPNYDGVMARRNYGIRLRPLPAVP